MIKTGFALRVFDKATNPRFQCSALQGTNKVCYKLNREETARAADLKKVIRSMNEQLYIINLKI